MTEYTQSTSRSKSQSCPECGERIAADALVCPECDARLVDDRRDDDRVSGRRMRRGDFKPHNGQMIMILGIISFFIMPHILGPVSWIMGYLDLKKIRRGEMDPEGESQTRTGMICGMISTILHAVILVIAVVVIALIFGVACMGAAAASKTKTGTGTTNPASQPSSRSSPNF
jgi:hypothetical protein